MLSQQLREDLESIINESPIYKAPSATARRQKMKSKKVWGLYGSQKKREARGPWEKGYQTPSQYPEDYLKKLTM